MITTIKRFEDCGRVAYGSHVTLRRSADGHGGVAGVVSCGSTWVCSVCSAKIAARRQAELAQGLRNWWADDGTEVLMLTLTMRHRASDRLSDLWDSLSHAWGRVTSGRTWQTEKSDLGIAGYVRVVELTHGAKGWHVHVHALLFLEHATTQAQRARLRSGAVSRWVSGLEDHGLDALDDVQDLRVIGRGDDVLADYFTKAVDNGEAVASEITLGQNKRARSIKNRTPFGILDDLIRYADAADAALWWEYEKASRGRRQMTWGRGTRDLLGIGQEQTDEDIADEELGDQTDDLIAIPADEWFGLSFDGGAVADVLDALEEGGADAALSVLAMYGVTGSLVGPPV